MPNPCQTEGLAKETPNGARRSCAQATVPSGPRICTPDLRPRHVEPLISHLALGRVKPSA
jgi:hypothetical protein